MKFICKHCPKSLDLEQKMLVHLQWKHNILLPNTEMEELYTIEGRLCFLRQQYKIRKDISPILYKQTIDIFFKFARENYHVEP